jgi:MFS family permease
LVLFLILLDGFAVAVALDAMRADLRGSTAALEWTMNAFLLAAAAVLPGGAVLEERFGCRRLSAVGTGVLVAASVACALAPTVSWLIAARAVQGAGAALTLCAASARLVSVRSPWDQDRRPRRCAAGLGAAFVAAPVVGGLIVAGPGWRWLFGLNVLAVLAAWAPEPAPVCELRGWAGRLDLERPLLLVVGVAAIGSGLARGGRAGWSSVGVLVALGIGALALGLFLTWSVPSGARHVREYVATRAVDLCRYASLAGTMFLLALFFSVRNGDGFPGAGLRLLPWTAAIAIPSPTLVSGAGGAGFGRRRLVAAGLVMNAFGLGWLMLAARTALPYRWLFPALIISGLGIGVSLSATWTAGSDEPDRGPVGASAAAVTAPRLVGGIFGIVVLGAVFTGQGDFSSSHRFTAGLEPALGADALLALVGAVAGLAMAEDRTSP